MHDFQQTKLGKDFTNPTIDFYCNFSFYAISLMDRRGFINDDTILSCFCLELPKIIANFEIFQTINYESNNSYHDSNIP